MPAARTQGDFKKAMRENVYAVVGARADLRPRFNRPFRDAFYTSGRGIMCPRGGNVGADCRRLPPLGDDALVQIAEIGLFRPDQLVRFRRERFDFVVPQAFGERLEQAVERF